MIQKCIVASDSFKGTLSSRQICTIAAECFRQILPECELCLLPVADGGEGTVECFLDACRAQAVEVAVKGPRFEPRKAVYARLDQETAVIEMAAAAGLPLVEGCGNPAETTTYGVGQLMRHAIESGCRKLVLGLGGSATNDGGCGCAAAMGVVFRNQDGQPFIPVGGTLDQIVSIDSSETQKLLDGVSVTVMSDVAYVLHGKNGAAHIFAPQKGADAEMTVLLDRQLVLFDKTLRRCLGKQVAEIPGAGAAGGLGAGCIAFFDAQMRSGIETVLELLHFDQQLEGCGLVITGEGCLDHQSLNGKVISGVLAHTYPRKIPTIAIVGAVEDHICAGAYAKGLSAVFPINRKAAAFAEAAPHAAEYYQYTLTNLLRLFAAMWE